MYRKCSECREERMTLNINSDEGKVIEYFEWETIRKEVITKDSTKTVTAIVKGSPCQRI